MSYPENEQTDGRTEIQDDRIKHSCGILDNDKYEYSQDFNTYSSYTITTDIHAYMVELYICSINVPNFLFSHI